MFKYQKFQIAFQFNEEIQADFNKEYANRAKENLQQTLVSLEQQGVQLLESAMEGDNGKEKVSQDEISDLLNLGEGLVQYNNADGVENDTVTINNTTYNVDFSFEGRVK